MSLRWSEEQLQEYQAKRQLPLPAGCIPLMSHTEQADEGPESILQSKIEKWCTEHGFYFFHDRSRRKNKPGHPDLVIAMKNRTLWLELKARNGRLKPEQAKVIQKLLFLGHEVHKVTSFKQFLEIIHK